MSELNFTSKPDVSPTEETKAEIDVGETPTDNKPDMKTDDKMPQEEDKKSPEDDGNPDEASSAIKADITERSIASNKKIGDFRPRLSWGGNDVLIATKEEVNLMNAVLKQNF